MAGPVAAPRADRLTLAVSPPDGVRITGAIALSPDGRQFVFVGQAVDEPPALWLRAQESGRTRRLDGTTDAIYPFWAPESDALGFFADGRLKVTTLAGSPPRVLAPAPNGRGGSWGPDGTILFGPEPNSPIFRVASEGGRVTQVTTLDFDKQEVGHRFPEHLDSRRFIYTSQAGSIDVSGVYMASLDAPSGTRLVPYYSNATVEAGHLLYVDNGAIVARPFDAASGAVGVPFELAGPVSSGAGGIGYGAFAVAGNLVAFSPLTGAGAMSVSRWFDRTGWAPGFADAASGLDKVDTFYPVMSRDGRKVAIGAFQTPTSDLWIVDNDRDVASRFTFHSAPEVNPAWSPDDTRLYYTSRRGNTFTVLTQSVTTPGVEEPIPPASVRGSQQT